MSDDVHPQAHGRTFGRFLAETAIYFAVISLTFLVLETWTAALVVVVGLGAAMVGLFALWLWKGPTPDRGSRLNYLLAQIYVLAGGMAGILAITVTAALWLNFGYDFEKIYGESEFDLGFDIGRATVIVIGVTAALTLLAYSLPLAGLRRRGVISGSFMSIIRADLAGIFHSPMVAGVAAVLAFVGLLTSLATLFSMELLVDSLFLDRDTDVADVAVLFPVLPMGLLAVCMLMAIARPSIRSEIGLLDIIRTHFRPGAPGERRRPAWQGVVTAIASAGVIFSVIYPLHFGMVAALSVVTGIGPWQSIPVAVDEWITTEQEAGRGNAEIAADLNRHGYWSADSPGEGLPMLIPGLDEELARAGDNRCVAEFAAAPVDPASLDGVDWVTEDQPETGLKYCLRLACPSPAAWDAPPPVLLYSSHPSRNYMWVQNLYIDVFAYGAAPEPGGFCTADGRLVEEFQG